MLQESIFVFWKKKKKNFNSLLKFWELKYFYFLHTISGGLFLEDLVFNTKIWKSGSPQDTDIVCWNISALLVKNKSMQLGFETNFKTHTFFD